jgi:excisionase family DNA binding protein
MTVIRETTGAQTGDANTGQLLASGAVAPSVSAAPPLPVGRAGAPLAESGALTERRALRVNEFCQLYGLSRATAYKLMAAGKLRTVLVGGRRLVPVDAAEALIAE